MQTPDWRLGKNDVHVWLARLHHPLAPGVLQACEALLDDTERLRLQQFPEHGPRSEYLMARALARTLLAGYAGIAARDWRFSTNEYGRPVIADPVAFRNLSFNLSHTEGLLACAVSLDRAVGVDVERVNHAVDPDELAPLVFAPPELERLAAAPTQGRRNTFFALWTLKEAYLKARGMGFSIAPNTVWFKSGPEGTPVIGFTREDADSSALWQFHSVMATDHHWLAVGGGKERNEAINFDIRWSSSVIELDWLGFPDEAAD